MSFKFISQALKQQQQKALYRSLTTITEVDGSRIVVDGKQYINFSSNDYLGLNQHDEINQAMAHGVDKFGLCASASSLVTGHNYAHQALEETICQWLNKDKAILFTSGFAANTAVLQALAQENTAFWLDKLSHASLIDATLNSQVKFKRFNHNDYQQLETLLAKSSCENNLIISEGVFSMDGDNADVRRLNALAKQYRALSYIDDAHAIGVIGQFGEGSASKYASDITMATLGKAIATSGAFVTCSNELHEYLVNFSRHFIYSTAMSPAIAWATKKSIEIIQRENWRREKIKHLSDLLSSKLKDDIKMIATNSSIHAIVIGDASKTLSISEQLKDKGIWLTAIRPPTVATNSSRLRVTLCSHHNERDINRLANFLNEVIN